MNDPLMPVQTPSDANGLAAQIQRDGFAVIRGLLPAAVIGNEFDAIVQWSNDHREDTIQHASPNNPEGRVIRIREAGHLSSCAPDIWSKCGAGLFPDIVRQVLGSPAACPSQVFCTIDPESPQSLLPWHFDRQHSLKLYILASEVTDDCGPLWLAPRTHYLGRALADRHILLGHALATLPNDVPDHLIANPFVFTGAPGDAIIFDSDCFHRASKVAPGRVRRVIRAHAHHLPLHRYREPLRPGAVLTRAVMTAMRPVSAGQIRQTALPVDGEFKLTRPGK